MWDFDNMLASCIVPMGSTIGIVGTHTYKYDALGRRVSKTVAGTTTVFVSRDQRVLADYTSGGAANSLLRNYVWGAYVDELITLVDRTAQGATGSGADELLYAHQSHQYHTVALTNSSGAVFERYAYTPYGDLTVLDPATLAVRTTAPLTRYTYTGREYDPETGSYHFRARTYLPTVGRFASRDTLEYVDGAGLYGAYFAPCLTDPLGLSPWQSEDWIWHYYWGGGQPVFLDDTGLFSTWRTNVDKYFLKAKNNIGANAITSALADGKIECDGEKVCGNTRFSTFTRSGVDPNDPRGGYRDGRVGLVDRTVDAFWDPTYSLGGSLVNTTYCCTVSSVSTGINLTCEFTFRLQDKFANPTDKNGLYYDGDDANSGTPYDILEIWSEGDYYP